MWLIWWYHVRYNNRPLSSAWDGSQLCMCEIRLTNSWKLKLNMTFWANVRHYVHVTRPDACGGGIYGSEWFIPSTVGPIISWGWEHSPALSHPPLSRPSLVQPWGQMESWREHRRTTGPDWCPGQALLIPPSAPYPNPCTLHLTLHISVLAWLGSVLMGLIFATGFTNDGFGSYSFVLFAQSIIIPCVSYSDRKAGRM